MELSIASIDSLTAREQHILGLIVHLAYSKDNLPINEELSELTAELIANITNAFLKAKDDSEKTLSLDELMTEKTEISGFSFFKKLFNN